MSEAYPDKDFPWTLYFNGRPMPKYAAMWHWWQYHQAFEGEFNAKFYSSELSLDMIAGIQTRIDHGGNVESADPDTFMLASLVVLSLLLRHREVAIPQLRESALAAGMHDGERVYEDLCGGFAAMHRIAAEDDLAFWTNGYDADRLYLMECIRQHRLPREHPDYFEAPHVRWHRTSTQFDADWIRRDLVQRLEKGGLPKEARTLIHRLPKLRHD
jgi:hypothetical protein